MKAYLTKLLEEVLEEEKRRKMMENKLIRQMGNARFFIAQSSSQLDVYRLTLRLMGIQANQFLHFDEKKFTEILTEYYDGVIELEVYYFDKVVHRIDGPAIIGEDGTKEWWIEGKKHRVDGPAVEFPNGDKWWYNKGEKHRVDGPAVELESGYKAWYNNGKKHRVDGPAVEFPNGRRGWWIEGEKFKSENKWREQLKRRKETVKGEINKYLKIIAFMEENLVGFKDKEPEEKISYALMVHIK